MKQSKTIIYGGLKINKINSGDELVPRECLAIDLPMSDKKALAIAINSNMPALLIGETGTGKTSAIKELAFLRGQPYVRVNMSGFTTPDELIGTKSVKDNATYFENGVITDAMLRGAILVIDEINATSPDCLFILHGLLDDQHAITLPNGQVIKPHADFRVFATCNPDYEGTKSMNRALVDRFPIIIAVDILNPKKEAELIAERVKIEPETAIKLVAVATMARKSYAEQKIGTFISTRALINVATLARSGLPLKQAYETTIARKTTNIEEQQVLVDYFNSVLKQSGDVVDNWLVLRESELKKRIDEQASSADLYKNEVERLRGVYNSYVETAEKRDDEKAREILDLQKKLLKLAD